MTLRSFYLPAQYDDASITITSGVLAATGGGLTGGAQTADVTNNDSTASLTYVDLTNVGPTITMTPGTSGLVLVVMRATVKSNTNADGGLFSLAVDGGTPVDADSGGIAACSNSTEQLVCQATKLVTGLSVASHTFKMQYRAVTGGTANFLNRRMICVPL